MAVTKRKTTLEPSRLRTQEEAARRIHRNLKPRTMERWRRLGTGPKFVRWGRRVGYTDEDIDAWIEQQTRRTTGEK
jgi:predicted DNA-binding transcriptional regulator AlpA